MHFSGVAVSSGTSTSKLPQCSCGVRGASTRKKRATKIVGGSNAAVGELPWQVGLLFNGASAPQCGGTLLTDKWVLTAAHCTKDRDVSDIKVALGEHDTSASTAVVIDVATKIENPNYETLIMYNYDFALLELASPVTFSSKIAPACLPTDNTNSYVGALATVSGWGATSFLGATSDILQKLDSFSVLNNDNCGDYNADAPGTITPQMLCAGADGKDSCQGDSGGNNIKTYLSIYTII